MDFTQFCASGTKYSHQYISGDKDIKLFLIHFKPKIKSNFPPVIFISGWGSIIDSWNVVLKEMTKDFEVYYLETREKSSSVHINKQPLTIESLGDDLPYVLSELNLINKSFILFGSSLGATVILDSMSRKIVSPTLSILIGPNAEFNIPSIWLMIARLAPPFIFYFIRPIIKWYMKKKYLDMNSDPKQYYKYAKSLDQASPVRLRLSAINFSSYKVWNQLDKINQKVLILAGSKDIMHDYENTVKIADKLSNSKLIDMETNNKTHSVEMVIKIREFINSK